MSGAGVHADEEKQAFLSLPGVPDHAATVVEQRNSKLWSYGRLALEVIMAAAIVLFLVRSPSTRKFREDMSSPVPTFPRKSSFFISNQTFLNEHMFASNKQTRLTLHNWLPISSDARGYISLPNHTEYDDLVEPLEVRLDRYHNGPGYMVSVFHQLHCLSYLVEKFQVGYSGENLTREVAHHSAHCFDYLRQSIMCAGDTTLEGKTEAGPGWGTPHECVDYDALLDWANKNAASKWRGPMPDELAIL
ncbi:oxidase [Elsinoe australis]|uniref:Oxidase n=1 Tax=Elsinoe australis TaxID=40998 RepID=A0A4U7B881_9PEZI|nr:oxidase [Elsinoe australis]